MHIKDWEFTRQLMRRSSSNTAGVTLQILIFTIPYSANVWLRMEPAESSLFLHHAASIRNPDAGNCKAKRV